MRSPLLGSDALPVTVTVTGRAFPIRHDFRDGIAFETLMFDRRVPDEAKVPIALDIWFGETWPDADLGAVIAAMLDFYACGKPQDGDEGGGQLYSYVYDYDLIYAAFLSAYGIDLFGCGELHWWRFRAMLAALPEDSQFMRVVGYRAVKITTDMPKEQRSHLAKMKRLYALPELASDRPVKLSTEQEYRDAIEAVKKAKREGLVRCTS